MVNQIEKGQNIIIRNKKVVEIEGARNVESFSEEYLVIDSTHGNIAVEGNQLRIEELRQDISKIIVVGEIMGVFYIAEKPKRSLFKKKNI